MTFIPQLPDNYFRSPGPEKTKPNTLVVSFARNKVLTTVKLATIRRVRGEFFHSLSPEVSGSGKTDSIDR